MRENRLNRQPSGRGRSSRRTRTSPAETTRVVRPDEAPRTGATASVLARAARNLPRPPRFAITRRALILFGVLAVLAVSYAGTVRVWMTQSQELALAHTQIEQRTARAAELDSELGRWNDEAYVRAQARARLGWVQPGEVGYRVIGADGAVLSGTDAIEGVGVARDNGLEYRWWDRLAVSINHADDPPPGR